MKLPSAAGSCLEAKGPLPVLPLGTGLKAAGDQLPSFARKDCLLETIELGSKIGALLRPLALTFVCNLQAVRAPLLHWSPLQTVDCLKRYTT